MQLSCYKHRTNPSSTHVHWKYVTVLFAKTVLPITLLGVGSGLYKKLDVNVEKPLRAFRSNMIRSGQKQLTQSLSVIVVIINDHFSGIVSL